MPAVPVPFRGDEIDAAAQRRYAEWMAAQPVAGVAVWAHTGRGPHLDADQRQLVLETWREALPDRPIIAGARDIGMAIQARRHRRRRAARVSRPATTRWPITAGSAGSCPAIAFYLYEAAGGVAYDDATLHAILDLPEVIGIKVATLDSVMTFQRIAALMSAHPDKLLITGEDRFLGYSIMLGARAALIGMGAALPDLQADLLRAWRDRDSRGSSPAATCATASRRPPSSRRWKGTSGGCSGRPRPTARSPPTPATIPGDPPLPPSERATVERAVHDARRSAPTAGA